MRDSVAQAFRSFSIKFEGYLKFMYQDVKHLVTTGMGNLIDPIGQALSLPWVNADGSPCSQQDISDAWHAVKARTDLAQQGGGHYEGVTSIRLTDEGIDKLIQSRLASNEVVLRSRYPDYDNWPADAQLGILSMSWAMGPAFKFPKFMGHVNASPPDFTTAADDSHMSTEGNGGSLVHRNEANHTLFLNAAAVVANGADPSALYYPNAVPAGGGAPAQPPATPPADPPAQPGAGTGGAAPSGGTTPPASDPGAPPADPGEPSSPSGAGTGSSGGGSEDGSGAGSGGDAPMAGFAVEAYVTIDPDDGTTQHQQTVQAPKSAKLVLNWVSNLAKSVSISDVGDGLAETGAHPLETKDATYVVTAVSADGTLSVPVVITVTTHPDDEVVSPHTELSSGFGAVIAFHAMLKGAVVTHATVGDEVTLSMIVSESADAATINGAEVALVPTEDGHKSGSVKVTLDGSKTDFFCEALREGEVDDSGVLHLDLAPAPASAPDPTPAPTPSGPDDPPAPQPNNNDDPPAPAPDPAPPAPEPVPPAPEPVPPAPEPVPPAPEPVPPAPEPAPAPAPAPSDDPNQTDAEIFAVGDGPEASAFQAWASQLKSFLTARGQTAHISVINSGSEGDGFASSSAAADAILARLQARTDGATPRLNTIAVLCHGEAFAVGLGIKLSNVDAIAQEIAKHVDPAQPLRVAYFACMAGASHPSLGTPQLGTFGDQRGNGGIAEATCASLIAAGLTRVQVDGHWTYGVGTSNPNLRRFYSEGMFPKFIRYAVGSTTGTTLGPNDPVPASDSATRAVRPGTAPYVEDPRPGLFAFNRASVPDNLHATHMKKLQADVPSKPSVYRTTVDLDAPGKGFTGAMHKLYVTGDYWMNAMYYSIQKIWADTYAAAPSIPRPEGLVQSPLPDSDLAASDW